MPLLVGLGNPGPKYDATRHNIGFALADSVAVAAGADGWKTWGKALVCKVPQGSGSLSSLLLAKPQTFMNLSGEAVQALMAFYKIPPAEVVVVTDDITLPIGSLRVRTSGGHGGHNGLRDIIEKIGEGFPRIRIGLGLCPPGRDLEEANGGGEVRWFGSCDSPAPTGYVPLCLRQEGRWARKADGRGRPMGEEGRWARKADDGEALILKT